MYHSSYHIEEEARNILNKSRSQGFWHRLVSLGRQSALCSFNLAVAQLNTRHRVDGGLQNIRVAQIVGSVSDNQNFDAEFYPKNSVMDERWTRLYIGMITGDPIPPIAVYQIEDNYYVIDGHHRVSVARAIGQLTIEAHVISIH